MLRLIDAGGFQRIDNGALHKRGGHHLQRDIRPAARHDLPAQQGAQRNADILLGNTEQSVCNGVCQPCFQPVHFHGINLDGRYRSVRRFFNRYKRALRFRNAAEFLHHRLIDGQHRYYAALILRHGGDHRAQPIIQHCKRRKQRGEYQKQPNQNDTFFGRGGRPANVPHALISPLFYEYSALSIVEGRRTHIAFQRIRSSSTIFKEKKKGAFAAVFDKSKNSVFCCFCLTRCAVRHLLCRKTQGRRSSSVLVIYLPARGSVQIEIVDPISSIVVSMVLYMDSATEIS